MNRYLNRGVSAKKEAVESAIQNVDQGLFPGAFCKIIEDCLANDQKYCNVMHADGAGTKSSLAYLYYKETGDLSVFKGLVFDAITMNIDDMICVGCVDHFVLSNTIGRNAHLIGSEIIRTIIQAYEEICQWFCEQGIRIRLTGGETADVGDLVRTLIIDTTVTARMKREEVIDTSQVQPGQVIIGLASYGQTKYENFYNSGIGSNGLTSAKHDLLNSTYQLKYPETYNSSIADDLIYCGPYLMTDQHPDLPVTIGQALLSPTRTYAPVIKEILKQKRSSISGIIHCSGGAQTKCLKFGQNIHYIKNNLLPIAPIFKIIQEANQTDWKEMYQVFNMGHRMEIFADKKAARSILDIGSHFGLKCQIIGRLEENSRQNKLTIINDDLKLEYV